MSLYNVFKKSVFAKTNKTKSDLNSGTPPAQPALSHHMISLSTSLGFFQHRSQNAEHDF